MINSLNETFENLDNIVIEENSDYGNMLVYGHWVGIIQPHLYGHLENNEWTIYYNDNRIETFYKDLFISDKGVTIIQINNKKEFLAAILKYWK